MSFQLADILGAASGGINQLGLHILLTAADGSQLWIPVQLPVAGESSQTSLWPDGLRVSLAMGVPPALPNVTTSAPSFIGAQSWSLFWGWFTGAAQAVAVTPPRAAPVV
jgi:hypothetical protein